MDLDIFKTDCMTLDHEVVVQKYLLEGSSYFFDLDNDADEFQFKKDIAESLDVHLRDIVIVGSGKLGFSLKPDKVESGFYPFTTFDQNKNSDLDIAIVSGNLFDNQLKKIYMFTSQYQNIWGERNSIAKYILKGLLKTNYVPREYRISDKIKDVQNRYKMKFGRDINIGIYKSWYYFESYHINNIRNINLNLLAHA